MHRDGVGQLQLHQVFVLIHHHSVIVANGNPSGFRIDALNSAHIAVKDTLPLLGLAVSLPLHHVVVPELHHLIPFPENPASGFLFLLLFGRRIQHALKNLVQMNGSQ